MKKFFIMFAVVAVIAATGAMLAPPYPLYPQQGWTGGVGTNGGSNLTANAAVFGNGNANIKVDAGISTNGSGVETAAGITTNGLCGGQSTGCVDITGGTLGTLPGVGVHRITGTSTAFRFCENGGACGALPVDAGGTGVLTNPDPTTVYINEEFGSGTTATGGVGQDGWSFTQIVGTTSSVANGTSVLPNLGITTLTTQAVSGDGISLTLGGSGQTTLGTLGSTTTLWDSYWIFSTAVSTGLAIRVGFMPGANSAVVPVSGIYLRFDTNLSDTAYQACVSKASTETCSSFGNSPGTNFSRLRIRNIASANVGLSLYDNTGTIVGSEITFCAAGCTSNTTPPSGGLTAGAEVVSYTVTTAELINLDAFSFRAPGLVR